MGTPKCSRTKDWQRQKEWHAPGSMDWPIMLNFRDCGRNYSIHGIPRERQDTADASQPHQSVARDASAVSPWSQPALYPKTLSEKATRFGGRDNWLGGGGGGSFGTRSWCCARSHLGACHSPGSLNTSQAASSPPPPSTRCPQPAMSPTKTRGREVSAPPPHARARDAYSFPPAPSVLPAQI